MMKLVKENCEVCGVEITGYGQGHFEDNKLAHMNNEHVSYKPITVDEMIAEYVEEDPKEEPKPEIEEKSVNIHKMKKDELLDYSAKIGMTKEVKYSMTVADIKAAIKKFQKKSKK